MPVIFHQETKQFHLFNRKMSYILGIMENGQVENLYFGKAIHDKKDFSYLHEETMRSQMSVCVPEPGLLSMHYTRQEYPVYGTGDYRSPALTIRQENGSRIVNFVYQGYEIVKGKPSLSPLPALYVEEEEEAETLKLHLADDVIGTEMVLSYTIYRDHPALAKSVCFYHKGKCPIVLERAMSSCVEFPDMEYEMVHLAGAWARERYVKVRPLEMGIQSIQGVNGTCSGAEHNPFIALKRPQTTEDWGEVFGFSFVYSGNFLIQTEVSTFDMTRVMVGIAPESFSWSLREGESFQTPETVIVYSDQGLNGMSQAYHRLYRKRLMRGLWRDKARPILLNNWEATYFDFDEKKILDIARKAKEAGAELFVLDDGWFGARNDDYRGLGDWYANLKKLPEGIPGLSRKVEDLGLKFGLWVELEMVNKDSDLYRRHPDWVIGVPGRFESHARHQHVLDFSRKEVVDAIYDMIAKIIGTSSISYIKWDMNRYMTEPYSRSMSPEHQGEMMHRYILGVYDLYTRLTTRFPQILFESCASGGARFDPGMLYFAPQTWTSDDTDANERTKIQYGTSYVYPLVSMGSHVSAVPNHQVFRKTPIDTRADIAYFGTFGYELDLNLLSPQEFAAVKRQIAFMKQYRELIQVDGDLYRILSPFEGNETAWQVVAQDKTQAIVLLYQRLNQVNGSWLRLRLKGLEEDILYKVTLVSDKERSYKAYGDELMYAGIPVDRKLLDKKGGDFASLLYLVEKSQA